MWLDSGVVKLRITRGDCTTNRIKKQAVWIPEKLEVQPGSVSQVESETRSVIDNRTQEKHTL